MIPLNHNLDHLRRSAIRVYTNLARKVEDCVLLTIGEPDLPTPQPIKDAAIRALEQDMTHYAPNQGTLSLRRAIADFETRRGMTCGPEEVLVTVGACEALYTALFGILNPGDEVIIPTPTFPLYESIVTIAGGKSVFLDLKASDFRITASALEALITPRTKAIVLNSPHNPTGITFDRTSLDAVASVLSRHQIHLICDNVYAGLSPAAPDLSLDPALRSQVLLCQSFSKPYAMTGWRVGYLVAPAAVTEKLLLLHAALVTAIPTFLQEACITALATDTAPMAQIYARRRSYVTARLNAMGLTYPEPTGAFYIFPDISPFGLSSDEFCQRMIRQVRVAAVPGSCFGTEGHIRLSYCCDDASLEKGLDRLEAFLKTLSPA